MDNLDQRTARSVNQKVELATALIASIPKDDLEACIDHLHHVDALGPVLDPSTWMRDAHKIENARRLYEVVLEAREELEDMEGPLGGASSIVRGLGEHP